MARRGPVLEESVFAETPDQELMERSTSRFLDSHFPVSRIRGLADQDDTFEPSRWREGAALGWTTLLVPEAAGGGSVSGNGVADLLIVSRLFGHHAAPGPLLGTNVVAAALGRWGSAEQHAGPLAALISGEAVAAWGHTSTVVSPPRSRSEVLATTTGDGVVLSGRVPMVEGASVASHVLISAGGAGGADRHSQYLVPLAAPGVELSRLNSVDLTRRYDDLVLRDVALSVDAIVGVPGSADEHDDELLDLAATILLGEMVGAMARAFAITLEWTVDRYSFGRPLGSYQAIKHRMADIRTQLEASEAVAARAAGALGRDDADARSWVAAGMAYVARCGPELVQECVQLHGGIGVTYEHDLHLFLRRVVIDAALFGSPDDFERRLGALVVASEGIAL
jgi:alkylation response protein AidB-like acyl-CoA dehydrogenase